MTARIVSDREQASAAAERAVVKVTRLLLLTRSIGETMVLHVSGFHWRGLFVELTHPYGEGFVPFDSIFDDVYEYDETQQVVTGQRKKSEIVIGSGLQGILIRLDRKYLMPEFDWLRWSETEPRR